MFLFVGLLLLVSIGAGVVVISTGVILNILNKLWTGNWAEGVFGRFGVLGLAFYWGALGLAVRYVMTQQVNPYLAAGMILVPLLLLFLKEPVFFALGRHHKPAGEEAEAPASPDAAPDEGGVVGFFVAVVEGFVEVMEAVLMYVSNTASFMRLAAYAMSHTGLCLVIFALEAAVREAPAGPLWSILLVIVGNLVVIVLEGLVVAVQALRLEYYEFFNKFFSGEGKAYEPFDLKSEGS